MPPQSGSTGPGNGSASALENECAERSPPRIWTTRRQPSVRRRSARSFFPGARQRPLLYPVSSTLPLSSSRCAAATGRKNRDPPARASVAPRLIFQHEVAGLACKRPAAPSQSCVLYGLVVRSNREFTPLWAGGALRQANVDSCRLLQRHYLREGRIPLHCTLPEHPSLSAALLVSGGKVHHR